MLYHKAQIIVITFLLLLLGCAAEKGGGIPTAKPDESFTLAVSDSIQFVDDDTRFLVEVGGVQDNRCPRNVNCITGGKATVTVAVGNGEELILCTGADYFGENQNSFLFRFNNKSYTIVLEEVLPYPEAGQALDLKRAILKIKQATD